MISCASAAAKENHRNAKEMRDGMTSHAHVAVHTSQKKVNFKSKFTLLHNSQLKS